MQSSVTIKKKRASLECPEADQTRELLRCTRKIVKLSLTNYVPLPFLLSSSSFSIYLVELFEMYDCEVMSFSPFLLLTVRVNFLIPFLCSYLIPFFLRVPVDLRGRM